MTDEQRTAKAFSAALSEPQPKPPPPAGEVARDVFRRAREQEDLDKPLPLTLADVDGLQRFGVEFKQEIDADWRAASRFWLGIAPGWQLYEVK